MLQAKLIESCLQAFVTMPIYTYLFFNLENFNLHYAVCSLLCLCADTDILPSITLEHADMNLFSHQLSLCIPPCNAESVYNIYLAKYTGLELITPGKSHKI